MKAKYWAVSISTSILWGKGDAHLYNPATICFSSVASSGFLNSPVTMELAFVRLISPKSSEEDTINMKHLDFILSG